MKYLIYFTQLSCVFQMINSELRGELTNLGEPFKLTNPDCEIVWSDAVQKPPETAPYYSAKDHRFSQKTIEYFKRIGGFTEKNLVPNPENVPSRKDSRVYATETKNLNISPVTGCLSYNFSQESVDLNSAEAPTVETAKELAKKLAVELGFDLSLLAFDRVRYTSGTHTRFDRNLGKAVTRRTDSGVFIPRLYAGQPSSTAGLEIIYGLNSELVEFTLCWRDVNLAGQHPVPNRDTIAKRILEGDATVFMQLPLDPTRLVINRIFIDYKEAESFRKATSVLPMLFLSGIAETNGVKEDFSMYLALP